MSARVSHSSECRVDAVPGSGENVLHPSDLLPWLTALPAEAVLAPITVDRGHQRDPIHVLVGLRATWTTELP